MEIAPAAVTGAPEQCIGPPLNLAVLACEDAEVEVLIEAGADPN
jgi:hypothetical protein